MDEIKAGDIVYVKAIGPKMVVETTEGSVLHCVYYCKVKNEHVKIKFGKHALVKAT